MALFSPAQIEAINKVAEKSKEIVKPVSKSAKSITSDIDSMSAQVLEYFKDSPALLITTEDELSDYIDKAIEAGYCGIDTETTGLDRIKDTVVGSSLYYPGGVEVYIPNKHKIPIFNDIRKNQLTYEQCQKQFQRLVDANVKMIFANADFDIAMLYKDYKVDFIPACYYDVILAWRCIKENELKNGLKELYNKYVLRGEGDPKKFNDFFSVELFPFCKPEIAKLYAANDAKITYELFRWQLPYITKTHPKCIKKGLQKIADVVWGIEFPMIRACAMMHREGIYIDTDIAKSIDIRYAKKYDEELEILQNMVQTLIDSKDTAINSKRPFKTGKDFNPTSVTHARYLCYTLLGVSPPSSGKDKGKQSTSKEILAELNLPETNQLLKVRSLSTLIGTFVKKLPKSVTPDSRIHAQFRSTGAATGRMCISAGTMISTPGHDKKIEDIKEGDYLYCYDVDSNYLKLSRVKHLWYTGNRNCVKLRWKSTCSESNLTGELICTPEHMIRTQDHRWIMAKDATPQDALLYFPIEVQSTSVLLHAESGYSVDGNYSWTTDDIYKLDTVARNSTCMISNHVVYSIEYLDQTYDVYDIEVEGYHNFIANGICVHNSSAEPNLQNVPSHATDIRHMFRATAARDESFLCNLNEDDNTISIKLSMYDSVHNKTDDLIKVYDLHIGDLILIQEGSRKVYKELINIVDSGACDKILTFRI